MEFTDRISKIIAFSELSPAEFAEEIGVQRSSISHILSGRNKPSLDFIVKIKNSYPTLNWDWIINGEGEMQIIEDPKTESEEIKSEYDKSKKKTTLPDLYTLFSDDDFGKSETNDANNKNVDPRESKINEQLETKKNITVSQRLGISDKKAVKRIVFFFEDGTFETYEN